MPVKRLSELLLRFGLLYAGGALLVLFWTTLESLFIKRLSFAYLAGFPLLVTGAILFGMIAVMQLYTYWRLKGPWREISSGSARADAEDRICRSLLRIPSELFWIILVYGSVLIPVYHVAHYVAMSGLSLLRVDEEHWLSFIRSFLFEQTVVLSVAILYFIVSRRLLRPLLMRLSNVREAASGDRSFLTILTTTFAGLLLISIFTILWYVMNTRLKKETIDFAVLSSMTLLNLLFAVTIFVLLAYEFRRELQVMIRSIRALLNGEGEPSYAKMPVLSDDETGSLAVAFNRLQDRITREYDELAKELQLARQLQLQLLPVPLHEIGGLRIAALSDPRKEVGSGFYDVIPLPDARVVIVAGELAGTGLPAALQMSAALLLLRAEAGQGGGAGEIVTRLNRALLAALPQVTAIRLGLAVADPGRGVMRYAAAGFIHAMLARGGEALRLESAAPPLGQASQAEYPDREFPFQAGDKLAIYSPAVARTLLQAGEPETALIASEAGTPLDEQWHALLSRYRESGLAREDDFTLLVCSVQLGGKNS